MAGDQATAYPDDHADLRDHLVRVHLPGQDESTDYVPRAQWQAVANERDELRKVLGLIAAEWWAGDQDPGRIDRLLCRAGESPESARAIASVIAGFRAGGTSDPGPTR